MPPGWGELLTALGDLAGAAIAVAVLLVVTIALIRGDLVPGYIYRAEIKRGDDFEARIDASKARDEAAAASAHIAQQAALAVVDQVERLQRKGRRGGRTDEPD